MSNDFEVEALKSKQETLIFIDEHKSGKMEHVERLQALMTGSDNEKMMVLYKKQIKQAIDSFSMLEEEELVEIYIQFWLWMFKVWLY